MTLVMGRRQAVCRRNIPACGGGRRGVEAVSRYFAGIARLRISCVRGLGAQDKTSWMLIEMAPVSRGRLFLTGLSGRLRLQEGIF